MFNKSYGNFFAQKTLVRNVLLSICIIFFVQSNYVLAQYSTGALPEISPRDRNNVDLFTHMPYIKHSTVSIGNGDMELSHRLNVQAWYNPLLFIDNFRIGHTRISQPMRSDVFAWDGSEISFNGYNRSNSGTGEFLTDLGNGYITMTLSDGTKATSNISPNPNNYPVVSRIETPSGLITQYYYKFYTINGVQRGRIQSIVRNNGLQLKYNYAGGPTSNSVTSIVAINNAVDYCDPTADTCSFTKTWPSATFTELQSTTTYTPCQYCAPQTVPVAGSYQSSILDQSGVTTVYSYVQNRLSTVTKLGKPTITYQWLDAGNHKDDGTSIPVTVDRGFFVSNVLEGGMTFHYTWSFSPDNQYGSSGVSGPVKSASLQHANGRTISVSSEGFTIGYDSFNRVQTMQLPYDQLTVKTFSYDDRGNVTKTTKTGTGMTPIIESTGFDTTCSNPVKCNKPNWAIDANGNQTDYKYYSSAPVGFLESVTKPAGANGFRPQTRYEYVQRTAWFKNSSGSFTAGSPIWLPSREISCVSGNSCSPGSNEEVSITYDYGPDSGPNNLFLRGIVKTAFDGQSVRSLRTCYGYDIYGHKISETTPKSHLTSCP